MNQTSREIITRTLKFEYPQRIGRQTWILPSAMETTAKYHWQEKYPNDIVYASSPYKPSVRVRGDAYAVGTYIDEWGVVWENLQAGHIGEVKKPMLEDWDSWQSIIDPPYEILPDDKTAADATVNNFCDKTDKFVLAPCCPRPWERYQFLRGTMNAMMDMADPDKNIIDLLRTIHEFYCAELELFIKTNVDAMIFMDDWGSQRQLLINPRIWRELFKPLYKDYCDIIHGSGKFSFMHSDGFITEIYPDLIEVGVDAVNSQLFCMDMAELAKITKGKITFWGEIDRQHIMTSDNPHEGRAAVRKITKHLYDPAGGIIAQFELGGDANIEVAAAVMDEWEKVAAGE